MEATKGVRNWRVRTCQVTARTRWSGWTRRGDALHVQATGRHCTCTVQAIGRQRRRSPLERPLRAFSCSMERSVSVAPLRPLCALLSSSGRRCRGGGGGRTTLHAAAPHHIARTHSSPSFVPHSPPPPSHFTICSARSAARTQPHQQRDLQLGLRHSTVAVAQRPHPQLQLHRHRLHPA